MVVVIRYSFWGIQLKSKIYKKYASIFFLCHLTTTLNLFQLVFLNNYLLNGEKVKLFSRDNTRDISFLERSERNNSSRVLSSEKTIFTIWYVILFFELHFSHKNRKDFIVFTVLLSVYVYNIFLKKIKTCVLCYTSYRIWLTSQSTLSMSLNLLKIVNILDIKSRIVF